MDIIEEALHSVDNVKYLDIFQLARGILKHFIENIADDCDLVSWMANKIFDSESTLFVEGLTPTVSVKLLNPIT